MFNIKKYVLIKKKKEGFIYEKNLRALHQKRQELSTILFQLKERVNNTNVNGVLKRTLSKKDK